MNYFTGTGRKTRDRKLEDQCSDPCIRSAGCDAFTRQCDYQIFRRKAGGCICGIKTGIRIVTENPRQVGPDRIVDGVGAYTLLCGTGDRGRLRNGNDI